MYELGAEGLGDENKTLKNVLPKNYASPDLDKRVLGDVVDLFTNMDMNREKCQHKAKKVR